ncbi:hypothetical protein T492DRAFT_835671 [Pavlovales sp. CCMP2436]|nr:hypothetical protein T492DRAFT_835671 [Pavlovales sp. CCMP2436]
MHDGILNEPDHTQAQECAAVSADDTRQALAALELVEVEAERARVGAEAEADELHAQLAIAEAHAKEETENAETRMAQASARATEAEGETADLRKALISLNTQILNLRKQLDDERAAASQLEAERACGVTGEAGISSGITRGYNVKIQLKNKYLKIVRFEAQAAGHKSVAEGGWVQAEQAAALVQKAVSEERAGAAELLSAELESRKCAEVLEVQAREALNTANELNSKFTEEAERRDSALAQMQSAAESAKEECKAARDEAAALCTRLDEARAREGETRTQLAKAESVPFRLAALEAELGRARTDRALADATAGITGLGPYKGISAFLHSIN